LAEVKVNRTKKKQLGQFMTPIDKCQEILSGYKFTINDKVLEPSFGCGNFIVTLIDKFIDLYEGTIEERITKILNNNIYGVEFDEEQYEECLKNIKYKYGFLPETHNLVLSDYFLYEPSIEFDYIIGNPPFGGTINPVYQDELDKKYGIRNNQKVKKETYSFFMIKSVESLKENGTLIFISSDTFLTIKSMKGLRMFLFENGYNKVETLQYFSEETDYPMVVLTHHKSNKQNHIVLDDVEIPYNNMILTSNFSWYIQSEYVKYFKGNKLGDYILGSGGITIGKNELFLREIREDNTIVEEYEFTFFDDPITLEKEISKARNNNLSLGKIKKIQDLEKSGSTKRNLRVTKLDEPIVVQLPNDDYCFYNKSSNETLFSKPNTVVYWKDDGDAVITFKKNGNWYLHGVGGKSFFKREGITWQLISSSIKARYLPSGYILDAGSPIVVLRDNIEKQELFFIIGWLLTSKCNEILKSVINHTKNIQSKDIERLPYPFWINEDDKDKVVNLVKNNINHKKSTGQSSDNFFFQLEEFFDI
jgi:tRNA1(Val) A37 N6-methylase TrmN6